MSSPQPRLRLAPKGSSTLRFRREQLAPGRSAPFDAEPGYYDLGGLWLYGNARLLGGKLAYVTSACGAPYHPLHDLNVIEAEAERLVLSGYVLVCGIHNEGHQRAAVVPLRWGSPRIVVLSGGFLHHFGQDLKDEPFRLARLWRYEWDPVTDLAISRRSPCKAPTFARHNPTVDRMIEKVATGQWPSQSLFFDPPSLTLASRP